MITKSQILDQGYKSLPFYDSVLEIYVNPEDRWGDFATVKSIMDANVAWQYVTDPTKAVANGFTSGPYRFRVQQGAHLFYITQEDILAIPEVAEMQPQYTLTPELIAKLTRGIPLNSSDVLQLAIPIAYSSPPFGQIKEITDPMDRVAMNGASTVLTGAIQQLTVFEGYISGRLIGHKNPEKKAEQRLEKVRKALGFNNV